MLMLWQGVADPVVAPILPGVIASLADWRGPELPPDDAFEALIVDIRAADGNGTLARAATRLNYDVSGFRSLMFKTNSALPQKLTELARATLIGIGKRWGELETWTAIRRASGPLTDLNLLAAIDLRRDAQNSIQD